MPHGGTARPCAPRCWAARRDGGASVSYVNAPCAEGLPSWCRDCPGHHPRWRKQICTCQCHDSATTRALRDRSAVEGRCLAAVRRKAKACLPTMSAADDVKRRRAGTPATGDRGRRRDTPPCAELDGDRRQRARGLVRDALPPSDADGCMAGHCPQCGRPYAEAMAPLYGVELLVGDVVDAGAV